jgi:hypothetical protein
VNQHHIRQPVPIIYAHLESDWISGFYDLRWNRLKGRLGGNWYSSGEAVFASDKFDNIVKVIIAAAKHCHELVTNVDTLEAMQEVSYFAALAHAVPSERFAPEARPFVADRWGAVMIAANRHPNQRRWRRVAKEAAHASAKIRAGGCGCAAAIAVEREAHRVRMEEIDVRFKASMAKHQAEREARAERLRKAMEDAGPIWTPQDDMTPWGTSRRRSASSSRQR